MEKQRGRETAILASKPFLIHFGRGPQAAHAIFSTQKRHGDDLLLSGQSMIEEAAP